MRFGFSTNLFVDFSLADSLKRIAKAGFRHVEILADAPHAELNLTRPSEYEILLPQLETLQLSVCNINANTIRCLSSGDPEDFSAFRPSLFETNPIARRKRVSYTRKAIRLAAVLGSPVCTIATAPMQTGVSKSKALSLLHDSLDELVDYADEAGVKLALEYEPDHLIGSHTELSELLSYNRMLWVNLDIGHSACVGENPIEVIKSLADRIANIHFEDIADGNHFHLPPGEGSLDLKGIIQTLRQIGYNHAVVFELYSCKSRPLEVLKKAALFARAQEHA